MWRRTVVRALAITGAVALLLSLGPWVPVPRTDVVLPGPWRLVVKLPLFESVIEGRVAMVCAPCWACCSRSRWTGSYGSGRVSCARSACSGWRPR